MTHCKQRVLFHEQHLIPEELRRLCGQKQRTTTADCARSCLHIRELAEKDQVFLFFFFFFANRLRRLVKSNMCGSQGTPVLHYLSLPRHPASFILPGFRCQGGPVSLGPDGSDEDRTDRDYQRFLIYLDPSYERIHLQHKPFSFLHPPTC